MGSYTKYMCRNCITYNKLLMLNNKPRICSK